jgi:GT2 family glycosyltransferase
LDPSVSVTIVTYNSALFIRQCLTFLFEVHHPTFEVIVVDNGSEDETRTILGEFSSRLRLILNKENTGFAGGQNQAIRKSQGRWVLTLNPDVRLRADFISKLVEGGEEDDQIGTVCGRLLSMKGDFQIPQARVIDSTGMYFTPSLRHFDRGSKEPDLSRYDRPELVFGATGAAALYRRTMIQDVSIDDEFFDSDFFAYREDADVAWRAQLLGWKCLYVPSAVAYHVRKVLPSNRTSVAAEINMHSVKNRFLMRMKNVTLSIYARHFLPITLRDFIVVAGCLLREQSSLPAFWFILCNFRKTWRKRTEIMRRRRADDRSMARWFSRKPVSFPALAVGVQSGERIGSDIR